MILLYTENPCRNGRLEYISVNSYHFSKIDIRIQWMPVIRTSLGIAYNVLITAMSDRIQWISHICKNTVGGRKYVHITYTRNRLFLTSGFLSIGFSCRLGCEIKWRKKPRFRLYIHYVWVCCSWNPFQLEQIHCHWIVK